MKLLTLLTLCAALQLPLRAQKMQNAAGEAPGPWLLGTVGVGKTADPKVPKTTALKGLAIRVGEKGEAAVVYDLDLCRMAGAWTGKFVTPMNLMSRGEYPTAMGEVAFTTGEVPGFLLLDTESGVLNEPAGVLDKEPGPLNRTAGLLGKDSGAPDKTSGPQNRTAAALNKAAAEQNKTAGALDNESGALNKASGTPDIKAGAAGTVPGRAWQDSRSEPFGPLPPGQARFKGFYVNGGKTILKWDIGGVEVLEMPGYVVKDGIGIFIRDFHVAPRTGKLLIPLTTSLQPHLGSHAGWDDSSTRSFLWKTFDDEGGSSIIGMRGLPEGSAYPDFGDTHYIEVAPQSTPSTFRVFVARNLNFADRIGRLMGAIEGPVDVASLTKGGPARWPETVTTVGELSDKKEEAYVVDTIKLPDPNPWGAPMFVGGFDFFPDGRAGSPKNQPPLVPGAATSAVCTFHGDVFLVSGIDARLEKVSWKRFASGLYHALGLKIVNGEIYVTCRDGLWRLHDLNGDGEADFYEAFNFDLKATKNFHEFVFDLQTDPAGNFYFAKAGPVKNGGRGFDEIMAHHGTLLRVSPDGAQLEVVATGFRAPNGIGCGPRGELTSGDNEGTWTPACKINWIRPGGFYGVVPLSQRDPLPTEYDRPLCWLPKRVDNSGGGQVWVPPGERWGPWGGQMLHLSYGTCSLFGVMKQAVQIGSSVTVPPGFAPPEIPATPPILQGGVTRFPLNFQSGIMRARFHPVDGQLYVAGLRGWQTTGVKNGAFQRVRYTGAPVRMPLELHATKRGVRLTFTCALDPATAGDAQNWSVEVWNYLWSAAYGSPELSTLAPPETPGEVGREGEAQFTKTQAAAKKHDALAVKSATLSADGRSVFLEIPEIKPVMQVAIQFGIRSADGAELRSEVIHTIHALEE